MRLGNLGVNLARKRRLGWRKLIRRAGVNGVVCCSADVAVALSRCHGKALLFFQCEKWQRFSLASGVSGPSVVAFNIRFRYDRYWVVVQRFY